MSIQRILAFAIIAIMFTACGSGDTANNAANSTGDVAVTPAPEATTSTTPAQATTTDVNAPNAKGEPAQNSAGVWHYTCPNGCADGAGTAMPCPKCGTTLAHNSAYHSGGATTTPTIATPPPVATQPAANNPFASPAIAPTAATPIGNAPKAPEPAQNAKGVWHYTCPKGCDGGGGSAIACSKCGTTLAHNTTYHN